MGYARFAVALLAISCASPSTPESRATAFLAREVPAWPVKNKCFSCHNNGDAARALLAARRSGYAVDPAALASTLDWLRRPAAWKDNGPPGEFSDQKLAALQFAHALAATVEAGDGALVAAAELVRALQDPDGSWSVDADGLPGSPVTYGRTLATVVARRIYLAADPRAFAPAIERAERWLRARKPVTVPDAAALLLVPGSDLEACLEILRKGQTRDGGWGPFVNSPPEVFDTALAILGLAAYKESPGVEEMRRRGRAFLLEAQQRDGAWPETTRPPGASSYAQRISTTGWALMALLASGE